MKRSNNTDGKVRIGTYYSAANSNRVTETLYNGTTYLVQENGWSEEKSDDGPIWAVTVTMDGLAEVESEKDMMDLLAQWADTMRVMSALDYSLHNVIEPDEAISVWQKPAQELSSSDT